MDRTNNWTKDREWRETRQKASETVNVGHKIKEIDEGKGKDV